MKIIIKDRRFWVVREDGRLTPVVVPRNVLSHIQQAKSTRRRDEA